MSENQPLDPTSTPPESITAEVLPKPSFLKTGKGKGIIFGLILAVIAGGAFATIAVNKISPTLEFINAALDTSHDKSLAVSVSFHASPAAIRTVVSDSDIAQRNIANVKNAEDVSKLIDKLSFLEGSALKSDNSLAVEFGVKYSTSDLLMLRLVGRTLYLNSDASAIAKNDPSAPFTTKDLQGASTAANTYSQDPGTANVATSFLEGTALAYTFQKGTAEGKLFDKYLSEALKSLNPSAKSSDTFTKEEIAGLTKVLEDSAKNNSTVSRSSTDSQGDHLLVAVNVRGFVKDFVPNFKTFLKANPTLAKRFGITDSILNETITIPKSTPTTLYMKATVKNGHMEEISVDFGNFITKTQIAPGDVSITVIRNDNPSIIAPAKSIDITGFTNKLIGNTSTVVQNQASLAEAKSNVAQVSDAIQSGIAIGSMTSSDNSGKKALTGTISTDAGVTPVNGATVFVKASTGEFCVSQSVNGVTYQVTNKSNTIAEGVACKSYNTSYTKSVAGHDPTPPASTILASQESQASLAATTADAHALGDEITSIVSDYTSFGTTTGNSKITLPKSVITFSPMIKATGNGTARSTGPGNTMSTVRLSTGSTLSSGNYGAGTSWCIVIANHGAYVKYTNYGLASAQTGDPLKCIAGK